MKETYQLTQRSGCCITLQVDNQKQNGNVGQVLGWKGRWSLLVGLEGAFFLYRPRLNVISPNCLPQITLVYLIILLFNNFIISPYIITALFCHRLEGMGVSVFMEVEM